MQILEGEDVQSALPLRVGTERDDFVPLEVLAVQTVLELERCITRFRCIAKLGQGSLVRFVSCYASTMEGAGGEIMD